MCFVSGLISVTLFFSFFCSCALLYCFITFRSETGRLIQQSFLHAVAKQTHTNTKRKKKERKEGEKERTKSAQCSCAFFFFFQMRKCSCAL